MLKVVESGASYLAYKPTIKYLVMVKSGKEIAIFILKDKWRGLVMNEMDYKLVLTVVIHDINKARSALGKEQNHALMSFEASRINVT